MARGKKVAEVGAKQELHPLLGHVPPTHALIERLRQRQVILFAGAGISMSVGLPSWRELMERIGSELEIDPDDYLGPDLSYHTLAEYYRLRRGSIGPLRSWMDRRWSVSPQQVAKSQIHRIIVNLNFPIIYTTNYDRNLEAAFELYQKPYLRIASARDLAKVSPDATQIIKFHGDFDDDSSLVFAETDYFDRLAFASPLDVKFRADAMGHSLLFVGYSMSDLNIRMLLHRVSKTWEESGYVKDRPQSFVFMARANPVQEAVLEQWGLTLIIGAPGEPGASLLAFMHELDEGVHGTHKRKKKR